MANVELDSLNLKSSCIVRINDTISAIEKTLSYFNYFDIPSDFSKRSELRNVQNKLVDTRRELNNVKNWIVNSCDNYNTLINNLKVQANKLPTINVKQRNNII